MSTQAVLERPETGSADECAHYAKKDSVTEAYILGKEIEALCGYRWIPSRDPEPLPICGTCKSIYEELT